MANIKQLIETKPISNRTYNLDSGDIRTPYTFNNWSKLNSYISENDKLSEYKKYLTSWYSLKTLETAKEAATIKEQYIELLKQILKDYEIDSDSFLKQIDYSDITDLGIIIPHVVKSIKNEILKVQNRRNKLPKVIKSFEFRGTNNGIELELTDYILRNFTISPNEYDITKNYNLYPTLSSVNKNLNVEVEELYDVSSNYFNSFYAKDIEDYVDLEVQKSFALLSELDSETIKYAQEGRYYNFNWENIYSILSQSENDYIKENISFLLANSSGEDLLTSEDKLIELDFQNVDISQLPIYVFEKYDNIKNNLLNVVDIFKKYSGSDIYYHKKTSIINNSGIITKADAKHQNILNLSEISIANIENYSDNSLKYQTLLTSDGDSILTSNEDILSVASELEYSLKSKKEIGGYFVPDKLGLSVIVDKNLEWEIDWNNSDIDTFYYYPNPNIYANLITSGLYQNSIPLNFTHSYNWMTHDKSSLRVGQIQNENREQQWEGYQSSFENLQRNSLGLNSQDEIIFLGEGLKSPWLSSDFIETSDAVDYSWIIIPSLKQYSYYNTVESISNIGQGIFKWIRDNKQKHKIDLVLCTGDLVTYNYSDSEWQHIRKWFSVLDGVVPYIICKGEYDYGSYRTSGYYNFNSRTSQMNNWFKPWDNITNTEIKYESTAYINTIFDGDYNVICSYPNGYRGKDALVTYKDYTFKTFKTELNPSDTSLNDDNIFKLVHSAGDLTTSIVVDDFCYLYKNTFAWVDVDTIHFFDLDKSSSEINSYVTSTYVDGENIDSGEPILCLRYDPENDVFYANVDNTKMVKLSKIDDDWNNGFHSTLMWTSSDSIVGNFDYDWKNKLFYFIFYDSLIKCDLQGNHFSDKIINFKKLGSKISFNDSKTTLYTNTNPGVLEYKMYNNIEGLYIESDYTSQQSIYTSLSASCSSRVDYNNQTFEYISPDNKNYLIFSTEFAPRTSILNDISEILSSPKYENHNAILLTHAYLYPPVSGLSGRYSDDYDSTQNHDFVYPSITPTLTAFPQYLSGSFECNDGKNIYYKLINTVPNFKFVFSGHHTFVVDNTYAERIDTTNLGNQVVSLSFETENANGWIRIVQFMNGGKNIRVRTVDTVSGELLNSSIFDRSVPLSG